MTEKNAEDTENVVNFVANLWDNKISEQFNNQQAVLVVETILNLQFSTSNKSGSSGGDSIEDYIPEAEKRINAWLLKDFDYVASVIINNEPEYDIPTIKKYYDEYTSARKAYNDEIIAVIGKVDDTDWYQIDQEGFKSFIDGKYLKELEQQQAQNQNDNTNNDNSNNNNNNNNQNTQPQVQTPQPPVVVDPPAPSGDGDVQVLPDGGFVTDSGVEIHPGYVSADGSTTSIG